MIKEYYMMSISQRCYNTAALRGQDVSIIGCMDAMTTEMHEYWDAYESNAILRPTERTMQMLKDLYDTSDMDYFFDVYTDCVHNTDLDELADVAIAGATMIGTAKRLAELAGESYDPKKDVYTLMALSAAHFVNDHINPEGRKYSDLMDLVVKCKMIYNDLRAERDE